MSALLLYSIKSALALAMLYLPYMLVLQRASFFRFNRMVLLGILLLSLVLPLCNVSGMSLDHQPVVQAAQLQMLDLGIPVHVLPEVQILAKDGTSHGTARFSLFLLASLIYIIGMAVCLATRLWQMLRLQSALRRGAVWQEEKEGMRIYCHAGDVAPFSWMRSIVISQHDYETAGREILLHEAGHIHALHSWDIMLLTLVQAVQWWNPLVYVLGSSLRDVHEYEADDYVLRHGISARAYQLLLIRKAVASGPYMFANNFNHSLTKKRITMMKRIKSNPWMRVAALYVIPVAALVLCAFATPKLVTSDETEKNYKPAGRGVTADAQNPLTEADSICSTPARLPQFPGGEVEIFKFLAKHLAYPKLCLYYGAQGRLIVRFVVEKDGSITNLSQVKGVNRVLSKADVEAFRKDNPDATEMPGEGQDLGKLLYEEAARVLKMMPKWEPAKDDAGSPVRSYFDIPVVYRLN